MCLYPTLRRNKKYTMNQKNGGIIPAIHDERVLYTPTGCGNCMECRKKKARDWQVRLLEDIRDHKNGIFCGFTFTPEELGKLTKEIKKKHKDLDGYELDNATAKLAVKRFRERWRKEFGKSIRHWFVTELGQTNTEHLHLHGIVWTDKPWSKVQEKWQYGKAWAGEYLNEKTVNYCIKYFHKVDKKHENYKPIVLNSAGIGAGYINRADSKKNQYKEGETNEAYRTRTGHKIAMPIYWRNKIYTDEEKEKLWIEKLDKEIRWINGTKIDISTKEGEESYYKILEIERAKNKRLGYGDDEINWDKKRYENERRKLKIKEKINKANNE